MTSQQKKTVALKKSGVPSEPFERKSIRLGAENYLGRKFYFLTLCFENRKEFGKSPRVASWLVRELGKHSKNSKFFLHAYCVMPDHLHILLGASSNDSNLQRFAESYKQETGFTFEQRTGKKLWQFKYYDRILRNSDSPESVAWYIWLNPVRKGLCERPGEYPSLGAFTEIGQRMLRGSTAPNWTPPWKKRS